MKGKIDQKCPAWESAQCVVCRRDEGWGEGTTEKRSTPLEKHLEGGKKEIRVSCHPVKKDKKIPRDHVVKQNNGLPKRSMF